MFKFKFKFKSLKFTIYIILSTDKSARKRTEMRQLLNAFALNGQFLALAMLFKHCVPLKKKKI